MTADTLMLEGIDFVRFRVEKDGSGRVTGLTELFADGGANKLPRSGG